MLCFGVYAVPVDDVAGRLELILTMVLSAVAFKFTTSTQVPVLG